MQKLNLPSVSAVITTYNEGKRIGKCLESIISQNYPKNKLEIIVVDDNSTDNTVTIVKKYTRKVFFSGRRFCEISRALGLKKAKFDLILLMDADNVLPDKDFLTRAVNPFLKEPDLVGSYPERFYYDRTDPSPNRYCSLFGLNDPFQFYSKAREHLSYAEDGWALKGQVNDRGDYYLVKFSPGDLLTLGAIGFLGKRELMIGEIKNGFFLHSDAFNNLINKGENTFAVTKQTVIHAHCQSTKYFFRKLARNFANYLEYRDMRSNNWAIRNRQKFALSVLIMTTFIIPFRDSIKGFIKKPDFAWFYHPVYCFGVVALYSYMFLGFFIASNLCVLRNRLLRSAE